MKLHHRRLVAGAAALCALAVGAPAASADSVAYVKDGNIWLSTPDGARQFQVTTLGGYTDVTQADDGSMIGLSGVHLHRLDRTTGRVLADFTTPVSTGGPTKTFMGPFNPALSPDGTKVAYTYYYNTTTQDPSCMPPTCAVAINEGGTGYSYADRLTGWDEPGLGRHSGWLFPTWVDNDTTVLSFPTHMPNADVIADTLSDGSTGNLVHNWFTDKSEGNPRVGPGDISRDQKKVAFATGANDETMSVYRVPAFPRAFRDSEADPSTLPAICYRYSGPNGGKFSQPTWSPDGAGLAWAEGDGIHVAAVPNFDAGCTTAGASPTAPLVIPGAKEPDWGPADVPVAAPPAPVPAPKQQSRGSAGAAARGPRLAVTIGRATLRKALRRGLKVKVVLPAAGRVTARASASRKVVATSRPRAMKAGARTVTLTFTRKARRALARRKAVRLSISVAVKPRGAARQTGSARVLLKR